MFKRRDMVSRRQGSVRRFEQLEARQLLAAELLGLPSGRTDSKLPVAVEVGPAFVLGKAEDKPAVVAALTYRADSEDVVLNVVPNKVAVALEMGAESMLPSNFVLDRILKDNFAIYEVMGNDPFSWRYQLAGVEGVNYLAPVLAIETSDIEMVVNDTIIVSLTDSVDPEEFFASVADVIEFRQLRGSVDQFVVTLSARGETALRIANQLLESSSVKWASPDFYMDIKKFYTPNDPRFSNQWHFENTGQGGGLVDADPDLTTAWDINQGGSADIVIGIIDDAVDFHSDLFLYTNPGEIPGDNIDNDGNGWIDDVHGWNFVGNNNITVPTNADDNHGTPVAGVAAAIGDNGVGVAGASYNSPVITARIFEGSDVATESAIAESLRYMAGFTADGLSTWRSADVVNNSWGGGGVSNAINSALADGTTTGRRGQGTTYLFAAGNGFASFLTEPAAQSVAIPGVIAVGATNNFGNRSSYSQHGIGLDIMAPSNGGSLAIDTADRTGSAGYSGGDYTGTGASGFGGTSSAAPLATGIAALTLAELESQGINFTPAALRDYLRANTNLVGGDFYDPATGLALEYGFGALNAGMALSNIGKAEISVLSQQVDLVSGETVHELDSVAVGEAPLTAIFRIRNQGTEDLVLSELSISGAAFSLVSSFGSTTLAMGEFTTFEIQFEPTSAGNFTGTVTITNNDTDESTFIFEISAIGLAPSISGTTFEDFDGDGIFEKGEQTVASRSVFLDLNDNGIWDADVATFEAQGEPVPILDNQKSTWGMTVTNVPVDFSKMTVSLDISHTFVSDLEIILIAPDGTRVLLANAVGGGGDNFIDTVFDDHASTPILSGSAPFTGSFIPQEPLAGFQGSDPNGVWVLSVEDFANFDTGEIVGWSVSFTANDEPLVESDVDGEFFFYNLANGVYRVRTVDEPGWTSSVITSYEITISDPNDVNPGTDFGFGKNDRLYSFIFDDEDGNGVLGSLETPLADRTTFLDLNGNGILDSPQTQSTTNSTPVNIFDNAVVTSTIVVAGRSGVITDVDVRVNITHTWNSDLDVFLIAPDGTRVELFTDVGGGSQNFLDTILDDDADTPIAAGAGPFTGSFQPEGLLATLNGADSNGIWILEIGDDFAGDIGTLNEWELILSTGEQTFTSDPNGWMRADLLPGDHSMGLMLDSGWEFTTPLDGFHQVTTSDAPLFDRQFGAREVKDSLIEARGIFYNNAPGSQLGSGGNAGGALDTSKVALLPGQDSSFAHYTNYIRGINGLIVDIGRLAPGATEADVLNSFEFAVWDGIAAAAFVDLPSAATPSVELVPSIDGTSTNRVKVTFPDNSLRNTWLRTTVLANTITRLAENDVFYFGNVVADVGVGNTSSRIRVNAIDTVFVRANQSLAANSADATNRYDLNRDGRVNAIDTVIVRANQQLAGLVAPIFAPSTSNSSDSSKRGDATKSSSFTSLDDTKKKDLYFENLGSSAIDN